jgi:predicted nucleic acid-binding protein
MAFVLDASVTLSWAFPDEQHPIAIRANQLLEETPEIALVPDLWWYEVCNILLVNERRRRISPDGTAVFLKSLANLRIEMDSEHDEWQVLDLARIYKLTVYDAAYLSLAAREGLHLATLDKALQTAARAAGVSLLD